MEALMDKKLIAKVKQAVLVAREQSTGRIRYSEFIKSSVRELVGTGLKKSELSSLIDVGVPTLLKWSKKEFPVRSIVLIRAWSVETPNLNPWIAAKVCHATIGIKGFLFGAAFVHPTFTDP